MCARIWETISACSASKRPSSASRSAGIFVRSLPLASSASTLGSVVPETSASSMSRPDLPRMSVATLVELDPGVLEDLLKPRIARAAR